MLAKSINEECILPAAQPEGGSWSEKWADQTKRYKKDLRGFYEQFYFHSLREVLSNHNKKSQEVKTCLSSLNRVCYKAK